MSNLSTYFVWCSLWCFLWWCFLWWWWWDASTWSLCPRFLGESTGETAFWGCDVSTGSTTVAFFSKLYTLTCLWALMTDCLWPEDRTEAKCNNSKKTTMGMTPEDGLIETILKRTFFIDGLIDWRLDRCSFQRLNKEFCSLLSLVISLSLIRLTLREWAVSQRWLTHYCQFYVCQPL